jgi:hypothetical protein
MTTTMPTVGTKFEITHRRPWGPGENWEVEVIACTVTSVAGGHIEYSADSVVSLDNPCPAYAPPEGGGLTEIGWRLFLERGIIRCHF